MQHMTTGLHHACSATFEPSAPCALPSTSPCHTVLLRAFAVHATLYTLSLKKKRSRRSRGLLLEGGNGVEGRASTEPRDLVVRERVPDRHLERRGARRRHDAQLHLRGRRQRRQADLVQRATQARSAVVLSGGYRGGRGVRYRGDAAVRRDAIIVGLVCEREREHSCMAGGPNEMREVRVRRRARW